MKFSTSIEYAVHGLIYLSRTRAGSLVLTKEVSAAIGVPEPYLRKVFQLLSRSGLVDSQKGARGGYRLGRSAENISLRDVVESIDGSLPTYSCLRDQRGCSPGLRCPVHAAFESARRAMAEVLEVTSIAELAEQISLHEPVAEWLQVPV